MNRYLLPLLAATLLASGCASSPTPTKAEAPAPKATVSVDQTDKANKAKAAIAAAEKSRDAAAAAGFEWRDTSKMIEDAKKAAAANEYDEAIQLAGEAEREGALAVKQSAIEAERVSKLK